MYTPIEDSYSEWVLTYCNYTFWHDFPFIIHSCSSCFSSQVLIHPQSYVSQQPPKHSVKPVPFFIVSIWTVVLTPKDWTHGIVSVSLWMTRVTLWFEKKNYDYIYGHRNLLFSILGLWLWLWHHIPYNLYNTTRWWVVLEEGVHYGDIAARQLLAVFNSHLKDLLFIFAICTS